LQAALRLYDGSRDRPMAFRYGSDIRVAALLYLAGMDCFEGERERGFALADSALAEAKALGHAQTIGQAYAYNAYARYYYDEREEAERLAEEGLDFCEKSRVTTFALIFRMFKAWSAARRGDPQQAVESLRQLIAGFDGSGTVIGLPLYRSLLAEALIEAGQAEEGAAEMTLALDHIERLGERFFEPMAWHLKGLCLQQSKMPDRRAIESCWQNALESAQSIGAHLYRNKADSSLVGLRKIPVTPG
jgi:tetratricopeptide (TPR) repeat protein